MTDNLTPENRHKAMQAVKSQDTFPEKRFFAYLMRSSIAGWNKHANDLVGKPDIVFRSKRVAIFIDGCFWHGCKHCKRPLPKSNKHYWNGKIKKNINLADKINRLLRNKGWMVIHVWEHQLVPMLKIRQIDHIITKIESRREHGAHKES